MYPRRVGDQLAGAVAQNQRGRCILSGDAANGQRTELRAASARLISATGSRARGIIPQFPQTYLGLDVRRVPASSGIAYGFNRHGLLWRPFRCEPFA
jgi:hypothetical protein